MKRKSAQRQRNSKPSESRAPQNGRFDSIVEDILALPDEDQRETLIRKRKDLQQGCVAEEFTKAAHSRLRINTSQALVLAHCALYLARLIEDSSALGLALRSKANVHYIIGENKVSLELHAQALQVWREIDNKSEIARTLNASIQPLLLLGEYDKAFQFAAEAKKLFRQLRDKRHLGHLQINLGNIFHRQDRFEEALVCYEQAYKSLVPLKDSEALAVALNNMSVSLISLNDFPRALSTYRRARQLCVKYKITILLTQTDYNIAYLYYLRGEYGRAIEMLRQTRTACEVNGDAHVLALCYLDLSEIYLELNLSKAAAETARESFQRFSALGMGYEEAKSITNEAIALGQQGQSVPALELFRRSRTIFVQEKNQVWPWLIDLYRGLVLMDAGRLFEAKRYCTDALSYFRTAYLPGKTILCYLLLARLEMRMGHPENARTHCQQALRVLASSDMPILQFQADFILGQIEEASGNGNAAYDYFVKAQEGAESLRSNLHRDELKIAFIRDKTEVYEHLVRLCTEKKFPGATDEKAFEYMDRSKSRTLAEEVFRNFLSADGKEELQSDLARRLRELREDLNWYYHRIEIEQLSREQGNADKVKALESHVVSHETELLKLLRDVPEARAQSDLLPTAASVQGIQKGLGDGETLIEYFAIRDHLVAAVVTKNDFRIVPVTVEGRVTKIVQALRFQFSKFRLGDAYVTEFRESLLRATDGHLKALYEELIAPIASFLGNGKLIIIPHSVLHEVPFQALHDGEKYLVESHTISYAPSAAIRELCGEREIMEHGGALVLGIPDEQAPFIRKEAESVASILPNSRLYIGERATETVLIAQGRLARYVHIATHGRFRGDNPMFSSVRLGSSYLNVHDLHRIHLPADLVVLSGCATGQNSVLAGDELIGLVRGFLAVGPRTLLLSLWDIDDQGTSAFMTHFYSKLTSGQSKADALAGAMAEIRKTSRHPYFWAPFVLVGHA